MLIPKDDWRRLNDTEFLKNAEMNPTDGEEICEFRPLLRKCCFCWDEVENNRHQFWFVPVDMSCCVCEKCYHDFKEEYQWYELDGYDIDWNVGLE